MRDTLNVKDWILISSYLDEKLTSAEVSRVNARLASEPQFKQALLEITYTRRMLWSLPKVRAPRNFMIKPEMAKAPVRQPWLQPALGFVSIAASVMLVVLFAGSYLFRGAKSASPMLGQSSEMSAEMAPGDEPSQKSASPMIINWNPVLGMGGGGGDPVTDGYYGPGVGGGGAEGPGFVSNEPIPPEEPIVISDEPIPTEEPVISEETKPTEQPLRTLPPAEITPGPPAQAQSSESGDLSTLILGVPDPATGGQILDSGNVPVEPPGNLLNTRSLLMILAGSIALLSGAAALFLRRR